MKKHVLVVALSTFPGKDERTGNVILRRTEYSYRHEDEVLFCCTGYYQLDPIPQFIEGYLKESITDVVFLGTTETYERRMAVSPGPDGAGELWEGTASDYYAQRLGHLVQGEVAIHHIVVDPLALAKALDELMPLIRSLYDETDTEEEWRLWMDTHGGFRDVSVVLSSAARFFATDTHEPISTDGIFSVLHSQDSGMDQIVNQTPFYFAESANAMKQFLSYGQYLAVSFRPYEGDEHYAFISYSHDRKYLTSVRNIFSRLQEHEIPFWFDDGIRCGESWRRQLEERSDRAGLFIGLLSAGYFDSTECWKELIRAAGKGQERYFFLLEPMNMAAVIEEARMKQPEIAELQAAAGVSEEYLLDFLGLREEIQWLQWYRYMGDTQGVNERIPEDADLGREMRRMKKLLDKGAPGAGRDFINFSNHPSACWSEEQRAAAFLIGERIVDVPFPAVDPFASKEEIDEKGRIYAERIAAMRPAAVMCQGEFTLSCRVIHLLQEQGIRVLAACTERDVKEEDGKKISRFVFAQFREYSK